MANEIIKIEVSARSIQKVKDWLASIQRGVKGRALEEFTRYIVGNNQHGLKHYPPYKYVTRKKAYGQTFVSDKQRRYVMAKIKSGEITPGTPQRTGKQADSWGYTVAGTRARVYNTATGSKYTMGNRTQARQPELVGWRKVKDVITSNFSGAIRSAQLAVNRFLKSK